MRDLADRDLWALVGTGDGAAFGALFERHAKSVYNFCFRRTADWALAEDLTSVVFLQAWRHRSEPLRADSALPLLLGITTNVLRDHVRSLRRFRRVLERVPAPLHIPDFAGDLAERIDDERTMRRVLEILGELPVSQQEVLLCSWSDLSYEEMALVLDLPAGTVRSRLSRARARLRELAAASGHYLSEDPTLAEAAIDQPVEVEER
jgi:RNA polymerase sigma-70 factor (ECF subfamily)